MTLEKFSKYNLGKENPMVILTLNCGSSSVKYQVYDWDQKNVLASGIVERVGQEGSIINHKAPGVADIGLEHECPNHVVAVELILKTITDPSHGVVKSMKDIGAVGHRVVHGGMKFARSVLITDESLATFKELIDLAPLHNPANITGIEAAKAVLPNVPHCAVMDTAWHQTMPSTSYTYALPREWQEKYMVRRYGFHGTSHRYVAARACQLMKRHPDNTNLITCHLGNGASITAVENGHSVETSMGFTPLEGLVMGTRCGDIDPAILGFLEERGYTSKELTTLVNKKSGLLGLSGISNDLRDLEGAVDLGNKNAIEALEVYAHQVRKYIGAYSAELFKVDGLVFTGGIGQHGVRMRERICHRLENIGIIMDYAKNETNGSREGIVSTPYSPTSILVVPTNEELQIALDVTEIVFPGIAASSEC